MNEARRGTIDALLAKSGRTLEAARSVMENGFFDDASSRAYYAAWILEECRRLTEDS